MSRRVTRNHHHDVCFKIKVVEDALSGEFSKASICRKYSLCNTTTLYRWIRTFAPVPPIASLSMQPSKPKESEELLSLKRQLQQQSLELKKEKMRADFYDEMIHVAEEMFNIPIRKKAGTKQ